jgi:hypothetical protein
MAAGEDIQKRIRKRAYQIWIDEGMPEGKAGEHRDLAKFAVSKEDAQATMLVPPQAPRPEQAEIIRNLGEIPTLTDQDEGQAFPSRREETEDIVDATPGNGR